MFIKLIQNKNCAQCNFTLFDTQFTEDNINWINGSLWATIINIYENKNMNVEKNLLLAAKYCEKVYYNGMMRDIIANCYLLHGFKEKYGKEFDKYSLLM